MHFCSYGDAVQDNDIREHEIVYLLSNVAVVMVCRTMTSRSTSTN